MTKHLSWFTGNFCFVSFSSYCISFYACEMRHPKGCVNLSDTLCVCLCLSVVCRAALWQQSDISSSDILSQFISPAREWTEALEGHSSTSYANLSFCQHRRRALQYISHKHTYTQKHTYNFFSSVFSVYCSFLIWNDTLTVKCSLSVFIWDSFMISLMNSLRARIFSTTIACLKFKKTRQKLKVKTPFFNNWVYFIHVGRLNDYSSFIMWEKRFFNLFSICFSLHIMHQLCQLTSLLNEFQIISTIAFESTNYILLLRNNAWIIVTARVKAFDY